MHATHDVLLAVTIVLVVAAITTVLFQRLHQPVVLGYLLAGLIVGPHLPIPVFADPEVVRTLSELGVILLMFSVGLETRLQTLWKLGPTAGLTAVIQCSVMVWLGFVAGRAFGWTVIESLFAGAIIAISSTTIIAKAFDEQRVAGRQREMVIGILIVEDLIAILLMASLTAVATGAGLSAAGIAATVGRLLAFLVGLLVVGMLVVPRTVRAIVRLRRPETTVVAVIGLCFACALLAQAFGYSVALGAFLAGSLVAESGAAKEIERRIEPVRDVFAAIFFVSVGMLIDPALLLQHWVPIAVFTLVVVLGKIVSVALGVFLTGGPPRLAVQAGMSLAQIGEFSFIIAGLGLSLGTTRDFLYPMAVAVSAITTLATPFLIRISGPVAARLDSALPRSLQTFATLYGSWLEQIRSAPPRQDSAARLRRLLRYLGLDAAILAGIVIGASVARPDVVALLVSTFHLEELTALILLVTGAVVLALPFALGVIRLARSLGELLAEVALPLEEGHGDFADAPRRALLVTFRIATVLVVGSALVAVTQPFLPGIPGAFLLLLLLAALAISLWRKAANLQGHVRASAQVIAEALAQQGSANALYLAADAQHPAPPPDLEPLHTLLPGIGAPTSVRLDAGAACIGRTLAELALRGRTGATVLAISRDGQPIVVPTAGEALQAGDILALAGTAEAVEAAKQVLAGGGA